MEWRSRCYIPLLACLSLGLVVSYAVGLALALADGEAGDGADGDVGGGKGWRDRCRLCFPCPTIAAHGVKRSHSKFP